MAARTPKPDARRTRLPALWQSGLSQLAARLQRGIAAAWWPELARVTQLRAEVQRFGGSAWHKIAERWPALAELVRERKRTISARYRPPEPRASEPPALSVEAVDALVAQLMASSSWHARASAALSLGHVPSDDVVQALVRALRDPSVEVAVAAVDALTHHDSELAERELLAVLDNADGYFSPVTRVAAISALARRLDVSQFGPVFAAVRDIDAEVSIAAIAVIVDRMPRSAGSHLLPLLRDKSGYFLPIVRLAAANALERVGALHGGIAHELLYAESDPALRRVLERAQYLTEQALPGE